MKLQQRRIFLLLDVIRNPLVDPVSRFARYNWLEVIIRRKVPQLSPIRQRQVKRWLSKYRMNVFQGSTYKTNLSLTDCPSFQSNRGYPALNLAMF
jgi:hypothetical protein